MKSEEFITDSQINELDVLNPTYVNKVVDKTQWGAPVTGKPNPPRGVTASVWQHIADPNTVVKLVGGGDHNIGPKHNTAAIAFVDFLVHHGYKSKHLPIVHGINVDDPEVAQIRMERLVPLQPQVARALESLTENQHSEYQQDTLNRLLHQYKLSNQNSVTDLQYVIQLLHSSREKYRKKYKLDKLILDLHEGNWMMRPDGTIVAVDPWFAGW